MESKPTVSGDELRLAMRRVNISGCLAMVYVTGIASPAFIDFMRALGARELHVGWLGGLPLLMFAMQFPGAFLTNRVTYRKKTLVALVVTSRLLFALVALLPVLVPGLNTETRLTLILVLVGLSWAMTHFSSPLYFDWIADLVPRRIMNRYWGHRQRWMFLSWVLAYLVVAVAAFAIDVPITLLAPVLIIVAVIAGIADLCLLLKVPEPPNTLVRKVHAFDVMMEPFRHPEYRSFISYTCFRSIAIMAAVPFFLYYLLEELGMPLWQTVLIWCAIGIGTSVTSPAWGRIADRHGHRPVLTVISFGKPIIVLLFAFVGPGTAFPVLFVWAFIDGMLNAGMLVATNGYMLTISPQRNRSMFVATIAGLSGLAGGLAALVAGQLLDAGSSFRVQALGREWNHFQLMFFACFLMRCAVIPLAFRIREVKSTRTLKLLNEFRGVLPLQALRFPIGLYRKITNSHNE